MPNLTLYVSENDAALYDEAKAYVKQQSELDGLSSFITMLVRRHLSAEHHPITLRIGTGITSNGSGTYRDVTFGAKLIAQKKIGFKDIDDPTDGGVDWNLYHTTKGKWVAVRNAWCAEDLNGANKWTVVTDRSYWAADSIDELRGLQNEEFDPIIPADLLAVAEAAATDELL